MLCVLTLKTAIETKAALQLGQQWLGTFLTDLQHMTHLQGLTCFTVREILTRKLCSLSGQSSACPGTCSLCFLLITLSGRDHLLSSHLPS
jgi:hypothetical protein